MSVLRTSVRSLRLVSKRAACVRYNSSAAAPAPVDPKIGAIVDQISTLTLLETLALIAELKDRLNIPDISFPAAGAGQAAAPAAAPAEKEVKGLLGLSLVESKKFVEAAPKVLKDNVAKEDADKIKATLEGLGAKVSLE